MPMPTIAPTTAWEVLIGRPNIVIIVIVIAADTDTMMSVVIVCSVRPLRVWMPA